MCHKIQRDLEECGSLNALEYVDYNSSYQQYLEGVINRVAVLTLQRLDVTVVQFQLHPQRHALRTDFSRDLV